MSQDPHQNHYFFTYSIIIAILQINFVIEPRITTTKDRAGTTYENLHALPDYINAIFKINFGGVQASQIIWGVPPKYLPFRAEEKNNAGIDRAI